MTEEYSDATYQASAQVPSPSDSTIFIPRLYHSAQFKNIYAAIISAQAEFTPVPKNKTATIRNPKTGNTYTYKYADLADVLAMALPILTKHQLGFLQPHIRVNGRLRVCTRVIHESGEWLMSDGINISESGTPQDFGADSSYYRRYDACSLLGIVADEDVDAQKNAEIGNTTSVRQPERIKTVSATHSEPSAPAKVPATPQEADEGHARELLVNKLCELVPDKKVLGSKARNMFPDHRSTKTLTLADLERLYNSLLKEKEESEKKAVSEAAEQAAPNPRHDVPADVAAMFDDGVLTTADKLTVPKIGKGLAQRLHKLMGIYKVHTEEELMENFLKPQGVEHVSDLPRDLYDALCDWAEGKPLNEGVTGDE